MRWEALLQVTTTLSEAADGRDAVRALVDEMTTRCDVPPKLALLFSSPHHTAAWSEMLAEAETLLPGCAVVGCSAAGVIGDSHEAEQRIALAMWTLHIDDLEVDVLHLRAGDDYRNSEPLQQLTPPDLAMVFADPMSTDLTVLLPTLDSLWPEAKVVGGLASGGAVPGAHGLFAGGRHHRFGAVVVTLRGAISAEVLVAQGCRPIGEPMLVTQCEGRLIQKLGDQAPVKLLQELYQTLEARDKELFRHSLFAGIEMRDVVEYQRGDFLIRQITGADPDSGAIRISEEIEPWSVVQFHLRDARTSREDLMERLEQAKGVIAPCGALMFTCVGRGLQLYGRPDHDTDLLKEAFDDVKIGGFFANGEIGPVAGQSHLHGYTSVIVLLAGTSGATP